MKQSNKIKIISVLFAHFVGTRAGEEHGGVGELFNAREEACVEGTWSSGKVHQSTENGGEAAGEQHQVAVGFAARRLLIVTIRKVAFRHE